VYRIGLSRGYVVLHINDQVSVGTNERRRRQMERGIEGEGWAEEQSVVAVLFAVIG